MPSPPNPSPILHHSPHLSATILDIPRSLETAQGTSSRKRIISTPALTHPHPSTEPKTEKGKRNLGQASIEELLLEKHIELVLQGVREEYKGVWCLPRVLRGEYDTTTMNKSRDGKERERGRYKEEETTHWKNEEHPQLLQNPSTNPITLPTPFSPSNTLTHLPPHTTALHGPITQTLPLFLTHAPSFPLILLDPPWPNRSAHRKKSYHLSSCTPSLTTLLLSLPIPKHLEEAGYVAVWVTNKPAFRSILLGEGGVFERWGVELVEEWVWVKITACGEPIHELGGRWRRCYEVLLVARRGEREGKGKGVKRRVVFAVPDVHSRKPNLKGLFEELVGGPFGGLEVFARNLVEGWWGWGDEVLRFQGEEFWVDGCEDGGEVDLIEVC